jgi:hypothetical protein
MALLESEATDLLMRTSVTSLGKLSWGVRCSLWAL